MIKNYIAYYKVKKIFRKRIINMLYIEKSNKKIKK